MDADPDHAAAESLFERWLADRELDLREAIEPLLLKHPEHAADLRELHAQWLNLERLQAAFGLGNDVPESHPDGTTDAAGEVEVPLQGPGRYQMLERIAGGGMGDIYRVWDRRMRRTVAMKKCRQSSTATHQGLVTPPSRQLHARFAREATIAGRLDHPGIVPVHEFGRDESGSPFITMKLVEGVDLRKILRLHRDGDGRWSLVAVVRILHRVAEAMSYAHDRNVVHRDLKPANIMVGRYGEAYVMDWGLAKFEAPRGTRTRAEEEIPSVAGEEREFADSDPVPPPSLSLQGSVLGTPGYMSPEQARGRIEDIGSATDVYALGAILYEVLAGHAPYVVPGESASAQDILERTRMGPPEDLTGRVSDAERDLRSICAKAMQRELTRRYASMHELAEDLAAYLEGRVVRAHESGTVAEARKWVARNRALAAALLLALLTTLVGATVTVTMANEKARAETAARLEAEHALDALRRLQDMSDEKLLVVMKAEAERLWPASPERIADLEDWLQRARELCARLPTHERALAELAGRSPGSVEDRKRLEVLGNVVSGIRWMQAALLDPAAATESHGWSVQRRLEFARSLRPTEAASSDSARAWKDCLSSLKAAYPRTEIAIEPDLMPLGPDGESGLWEFALVSSGIVPRRGPDGALSMGDDTALVLVLLPGGAFVRGAQRQDPSARHHDPAAWPNEGPPHVVQLSAFYIAKFEMTQGQWLRLFGHNPSENRRQIRSDGTERELLSHPVELIDRGTSWVRLGWFALDLPTEAQWEYACRAGTDSPWWTGESLAELQGRANLRDRVADWPGFTDGFSGHAPVGSFPANAFGLHDTIGNVWEWCLDGLAPYAVAEPMLDPLADFGPGARTVFRGGAYASDARAARSSSRMGNPVSYVAGDIGVRPVRRLSRGRTGSASQVLLPGSPAPR